jgi:peroxiredoxin
MAPPRLGERVPRALAEAEVVDAAGARVVLGGFWQGNACVVIFLRHFGCVGCSEQVTELAPRLDELGRLGVRVVLVGNGAPAQRDGFVERHALAGAAADVVTDEALAAYRAAGLLRSLFATLGPRSLWESARAMGRGHPHRAVQGDPTQQGGALVVDRRGVVVFYKRNRSIGDHAPASDLVEAALRVAIERQPLLV